MELRSEQRYGENYFHSGDAIFALATVPGQSAVAVFRCSGAEIWHCFAQSFSRYRALVQAASHTAVYGFLLHPQSREQVDEVLLLKFCAPRSYSGEDMLEVHCHGSLAVLDAVRECLLALGLRQAERGEFSYRSVKLGKRSLHQAEAVALLSQSQSQNQRRSALEQFHSPMSDKLRWLRAELLQVLARSELQLDYDETELEFHYQLPDSLSLARESLAYLENCLASYQMQQRYWKEYKIVLLGAANSGKSSLFNRLLTRQRSIVSQRAGTTRDYLEAHLELDSQGILLYDTAGLRGDSQDSIEQEGIQRSWQLVAQADVLLLLSDARIALSELLLGLLPGENQTLSTKTLQDLLPREFLPDCAASDRFLQEEIDLLRLHRQKLSELAGSGQTPVLELWNKIDLLSENLDNSLWPQIRQCWQQKLGDADGHFQLLFCSAEGGQGIPELIAQLQNLLPAQRQLPTQAPVSERQARLLSDSAELLREYCQGLEEAEDQLFDLDWASELLRQICGRLGEVTGEACNATMLREIFQQFCVGK